MSSGGGGQTSGKTSGLSTQTLAPAYQTPAKWDVASLMGLIYPGSTVPSNWFSTKGFSAPTTSTPSTAQAQQNIANSPLQSVINDPIQNALFSPTVMGSPFLQNLIGNNPNAAYGAISPAASQQFASLYGPQSMQGLSWIPYFNPGPFTGTNTGRWSWPYATGGGVNPNQGQTAGTSQIG